MIDRIIQVNQKNIIIAQDLSLSHAGTVWDGALVMSYYLNKNKSIAHDFLSDKNVLQLGSGTGIVGICACVFNPRRVYLTDLQEYMKILSINKQKNMAIIPDQKCLIVQKLQWGNKQDMQKINQVDTIIGSQLAYDKQNVVKLMQTIKYYKNLNKNMKVLISYQKYLQDWKNIKLKFDEYYPNQYKIVGQEQMDEDYRDQKIGIIYMP